MKIFRKQCFKNLYLPFVVLLLGVCMAGGVNHAYGQQGQNEKNKEQVNEQESGNTRRITVVNYEFEGTKQWLPGTIVVNEGDDVELNLVNNVPSGIHGFSIPDFKVKADVKKGEKKTLTFKADKAGIFSINCHLHPAHVGGQFIVLKK